jgi:hypothetical protein
MRLKYVAIFRTIDFVSTLEYNYPSSFKNLVHDYRKYQRDNFLWAKLLDSATGEIVLTDKDVH